MTATQAPGDRVDAGWDEVSGLMFPDMVWEQQADTAPEVRGPGKARASGAHLPTLIPLRDQFGMTIAYAIVDAERHQELTRWRWSLDYRGYAIRSTRVSGKQKSIRMHNQVFGPVDDGLEVDHCNRNKLDNRRANLRATTHSENMRNRGPRTAVPKSGHTGITWDRLQERWLIAAWINGQKTRYGSYATVEEALAVVESAGLKLSRRAA